MGTPRSRSTKDQHGGRWQRLLKPETRLPLAAAVVVLVLTGSGLADRWELPFRDLLLSWATPRPPRFTVAVVVDEASLARFGRFPWPRKRLAEVASAISAAGARGLVVDLLLVEPDPDDASLATSLQRVPAVLPAVPQPQNQSWILPAPPLVSAGTLAHATYDADHDGVVRTVAASKQAGNRALPALSLAAAALVDPQPLPVGKSLRPDFRNRARDIPQVSVEVLAMLAAHPWPGNVRELEQVVRRMLINTKGLADADELRRLWQTSPFPTTAPAASHALTSLEEAERHHILAVLS